MESKDDTKQNTADMTQFVQNLLTQMQTRFQTMSDSIVSKNILFTISFLMDLVICIYNNILCWNSNLKIDLYDLNMKILDEMGERISELEQSINDLRAEMGAEGTQPPPSPSKKDGSA
ncbi:hypothetical protein L1887_21228 [Cichorium endivia]|nr:hypothetical protein L1887_21228 [Cichorium endivia]